jgi:hypothetical protein
MRAALGQALVAACLGLVLPAVAIAHSFESPEHVQADGAGNFSYQTTTTLTSPVAFGSLDVDGRDNTDLGWMHGDGFCIQTRQPGTYSWTVSGKLVDVTRHGSVTVRDSYCDGWTGEGTTVILAPVVSNEAQSWGAVKALFEAK